MTENFGALWIDKYSDAPDVENSRSWRLALKGLTVEQINYGLMQIIEQCLEYPPTPPKFRGMCLESGSDKADKLFYQATHWNQLEQSEKTREALYIIRNLEDYSFFKRLSTDKARQMFDKAYMKMLQHMKSGGELPEFAVEIEYEEKPALPKEELRSRLQGILGSLGA